MTHLTEEQLILHFYGELESGQTSAHLDGCGQCREQLTLLRHDMAAFDHLETPQRDSSYESEVWNRLRWKLGRQQATRPWIPLAAAAAVALAVAVATRQPWTRMSKPGPKPAVMVGQADAPGTEKLLVLVVNEHFDRSARLLLEVSNIAPGKTDFGKEQQSAEELVQANRLYRQTATRSGQRDLAAVLEELEPILVELARGTPGGNESELRALQRRIESRGLVFKLRILAGESEDTDQPQATPTTI